LEDDISAVEEKIGLMTDLLRPVRHGAASKTEGLTDDSGFWIPRAYGILAQGRIHDEFLERMAQGRICPEIQW
jgi:hypothetical protein